MREPPRVGVREFYGAETDAEARDKTVHGILGRAYCDNLSPLFAAFNLTGLCKHDPSLPNAVVTLEYLVDHGWLAGSPQTVTEKMQQMYNDIGSFGCLLVRSFDHSEDNPGWAHSQRLLAETVMPHVTDVQLD